MNCPNCGSHITSEQQYCRSCGSQLTGEGQSARGNWTFPGLIMAFAGVMIALLGRMLLHQEMVTLVGVLVSLAGMFLIGAAPFLSARQKKRAVRLRAYEPVVPASTATTAKLLPVGSDDYIPVSVTENTTNLLTTPVTPGSGRPNPAQPDRLAERP